MKNVLKSLIIVVLIVLSFSSCKSDDDPQTQVSVKITDGPFPFNLATEANVTVKKIELKNENGEYVTVFEGEAGYNMVSLTNGVSADVTNTEIKPGVYSKVKITIKGEGVKFSNGTNMNIFGSNTSTRTETIQPALVIEDGTNSNLLFDLDLSNSFGFSGAYGFPINWISNASDISNILFCHFTPSFRVVDLDQTGEISGTVTLDGAGVANAQVTITANGDIVHTHTEENGTYKFIGILDGNYTVTVETNNNLSGTNSTVINGTGTSTCDVSIN